MKKNPTEVLQQYWGFTEFRGSQEKIIIAVLNKQDVLALLPTGGGKSMCFQVPAMVKDGICIVVSPLIALIQNQVDSLRKRGIKAIALTGGIPFDEVNNLLDNCIFGNYKFLYLSPERLQQEVVQNRIQKMNVNLIAIDEAHCISQWGHDFRPAYLECSKLRELLPKIPIIALTATATKQVATDIIDHLKFIAPVVVRDSFSRDNISFKIYYEEDKHYRLKLLCSKINHLGANSRDIKRNSTFNATQASEHSNLDYRVNESAIVYVRTRRLSQEIAQYLNQNNCSATYFHGGISKQEKEKKLNLWLENKVQIIVATNAFGMGIDKPDVRLVVHYQIPDCIENYYQEAGRAGRDGQYAEAVLITNKTDQERVKKQFLSVLPDITFLKLVYNKLNNYFQIPFGEGSDAIFQLNFNAFCDIYSLKSMLTYNALRILDQNSVLALSESFSKKATVRFTTTKEQLFNYFEKNTTLVSVTQTILRTYGGIFDFDIKLNIYLIAKKCNVKEANVIKILEQLKKDEIISYTAQHSDLEITFLVPREDDSTINIFAKKVKERQQIKIENINHILGYIANQKICRSKQLLDYFGETIYKDCGICDVCLNKNNTSTIKSKSVSQEIIIALKDKCQTSRQLIATIPYDETIILKAIQGLLENSHLKINTKNEYELIS